MRIEYGAWGPGASRREDSVDLEGRLEQNRGLHTIYIERGCGSWTCQTTAEDGNGSSRCDPTGKGRGVDDCRPVKLRLCGCAGNAACDLHWRADRQYSSSLVEQRAPHAAAYFGASSVASLAGLFNLMDLTERERRIMRRFGLIGQAAELLAAGAVERDTRKVPRVSKPLRDGFSGMLWSAASICTAGAMVLSLLPGDSRCKRAITGLLGLAGGACVRFGIFHAGKRSARDPHAAFMHRP